MAKDKKNEGKAAAMAAALEKANREAGYDIPLAFAALNAITIQGQREQLIPQFESQCDFGAVIDVVMRANGCTLNEDELVLLLNFAIAYGWHYAKEGASLLRSEAVKEKLLAFVDANEKIPIVEKGQRKEAIGKGYKAMENAIERSTGRLKLQRELKK